MAYRLTVSLTHFNESIVVDIYRLVRGLHAKLQRCLSYPASGNIKFGMGSFYVRTESTLRITER